MRSQLPESSACLMPHLSFLHMSETAAPGRFREFSLQSNFGSCPDFSPAFPLLLQLWYPIASKNITLQLFTRGRWRNCIKSPSDRKVRGCLGLYGVTSKFGKLGWSALAQAELCTARLGVRTIWKGRSIPDPRCKFMDCKTGGQTAKQHLTKAEQTHFLKPFLIAELLCPSSHLGGPPLDSFQQVHVLPVLGTPEVDAALQVGSHQGRETESPPTPSPPALTAFDATHDMFGFLGLKGTGLGHVQALIHCTPKSFSAGLLWICSSPAWIDTGGCPDSGAAPCTW
ncbi:uncharacterized protein LOC119698592 isoform X2 [Motacilla alba alba]|uniref:uncharacterized protein LOC119698592 isoform X2 n=1 Tax=Motacilla alba alba TaxID=1094192 RepID=UPI0018D546A0|nr:uncharacterized protein LOC119698592 isoform X2 [Motacilla alba alba]